MTVFYVCILKKYVYCMYIKNKSMYSMCVHKKKLCILYVCPKKIYVCFLELGMHLCSAKIWKWICCEFWSVCMSRKAQRAYLFFWKKNCLLREYDPLSAYCCVICHFSTLQHTATRCSTLQHTATHCNALQQLRESACISIRMYITTWKKSESVWYSLFVAVRCSVLQCVAVCCSVLPCIAVWYSDRVYDTLSVYCSVLQCVALYCSVLQWGNTLQ